jgi:hypothetical protein
VSLTAQELNRATLGRQLLLSRVFSSVGDAVRRVVALQTLVRRYLEGFGPASIADMARFALVQRSRVKVAVQALGGSLVVLEGSSGVVLYDVPGGDREPEVYRRYHHWWSKTFVSLPGAQTRVLPG